MLENGPSTPLMPWTDCTSVGDCATTRKPPAGMIVFAGKVKSAAPSSRQPLMSSGVPSELNSSTNSRLRPSTRSIGLNMISEMTRLVRRLDWPSGSTASGPEITAALVTLAKSRNAAVVVWLVLWLEAAKPSDTVVGIAMVAEPSDVQFSPSKPA